MREIKFRVWDKTKNKFILNSSGNRHSDVFAIAGILLGYLTKNIDLDRLEFHQWTGLKDKNGKPIYEGDFIREVFEHNELTDGDRELDYPENTIWDNDGNMVFIDRVVFQNGAFGILDSNDKYESFDTMRGRTDAWDEYDCEVVGNIYEGQDNE